MQYTVDTIARQIREDYSRGSTEEKCGLMFVYKLSLGYEIKIWFAYVTQRYYVVDEIRDRIELHRGSTSLRGLAQMASHTTKISIKNKIFVDSTGFSLAAYEFFGGASCTNVCVREI